MAAPSWLSSLGPTGTLTVEELAFDNTALRKLPLDPITDNHVRSVPNACFSRVAPTPVDDPKLVAVSPSALALLGLDVKAAVASPQFVSWFSGNEVIPGAEPAAHCYCGHQFGHFSGQLGDGATMYLGEVVNPDGERWELQFKGAGLTPYSRTADGRKVLRSSLREFLCSEAMHALGVPTTRAGTLATSSTTVHRDQFYTGAVVKEPCSIITRIAPTFIRFGSFEVVRDTDPVTGRSGPSPGNADLLQALVNYCTSTFFPDVHAAHTTLPERCLAMYREVVHRTARLVAAWQTVGFCHGVLNTDNMSIVGLTIDYGPFGFMDRFDPDFICNSSDDQGRYSYRKQPEMCKWNCQVLGDTLSLIMPGTEWRPVLDEFDVVFEAEYRTKMRAKLGLSVPDDADDTLFEQLFKVMASTGADFTNTFRLLALVDVTTDASSDAAAVDQLLQHVATPKEMASSYEPTVPPAQLQMLVQLMERDPRLAFQRDIIVAEVERQAKYKQLLTVDADAKAAADRKAWAEWLATYRGRLVTEAPPAGASRAEWQRQRVSAMNAANPKYVLRNYMAEAAIKAATAGDYDAVQAVQAQLASPFTAASGGGGAAAEHTEDGSVGVAPSAGAGAGGPAAESSHAGDHVASLAQLVDVKPPAWACSLKVS